MVGISCIDRKEMYFIVRFIITMRGYRPVSV
jgi:hypothetical protein